MYRAEGLFWSFFNFFQVFPTDIPATGTMAAPAIEVEACLAADPAPARPA